MRRSATLPSLPALRAFEAVGRLLSFRRAGEELSITQSAVSHHIATLERELKTALFVRKARSIAFTTDGALFFGFVTQGFDAIAQGMVALGHPAEPSRLRVSMLASFAANWLVPRLHDFHARYPDITLDIDPTRRLADLDSGEADLAIRFGDGQWPGTEARLLMAEHLVPVASPVLLGRIGPIKVAADLLDHPLLFASRPSEWTIWALARGLNLSTANIRLLNDYNIVLQAALDGHGIAMGRMRLIGARLRDGSLIPLWPDAISSPLASHWLVTALPRPRSPALATLIDWLLAEAAGAALT